ncbi:HicA toxin of toxin-antitoxin [Desulfocicer vacuolatum DSM 3385]|uniref:HicA toxin of toxin-antitoxin n=1 Tax=Desulfocicer vacuolatum DSM 3385 TaxID=1121400 RepID=A0A1W1Z2A2_9BACT|nr:type II toxin-antitoxin system HicA family toxin [Desulfocicer vacuolatum]SMC42442.1 HicA toxin of toxin-antitoxin [Desulfocicer vacuolatum DSM 3385]
MKRKEFIRYLTRNGCVLVRHGSRHDVYQNPVNGEKQPVPRHKEIKDILANHIKKQLGVK